MLSTVLVPLDESPQARQVLPYAAHLVTETPGRVVLLRAVPPNVDLSIEEQARLELRHTAADLHRTTGVRVEWSAQSGDPAPTIVTATQVCGADLIAMATDRWSEIDTWLNGSVADRVVRTAHQPVLLTSPSCRRTWSATEKMPRIVVPLDGSSLGEEILPKATSLAQALHATLLLVHVEPTGFLDGVTGAVDHVSQPAVAQQYLREVAESLGAQNLPVITHALRGPVVPTLATFIQEQDAVVLALATHGRTGLAALLLGSVARHLLHQSTVPVLLYRPAALRQASPSGGQTAEVAKASGGARRSPV